VCICKHLPTLLAEVLLTGRPLTEAQLLRVCHAPPNDPARERGLTLRRVSKVRRPKPIDYGASPQAQATSPTGLAFPSRPSDHESDDPTKLGTTRASQIPAL
jgi:mitogen-activated protein kinase kinase kinase